MFLRIGLHISVSSLRLLSLSFPAPATAAKAITEIATPTTATFPVGLICDSGGDSEATK